MLLCRANHALRDLHQKVTVSDRYRRVSEQNRIKRECLYYFQIKNGSARHVSIGFS